MIILIYLNHKDLNDNYNRLIKLKLSKYLYDKSKCKNSWPILLYFIKNEEKDVKEDIYK